MYQIPVQDRPAYRQKITLDDVPYSVVMIWNERAQGWTLSLEDRDGAPLLTGRRIVLGLDVFAGFHHLEIPEGALFAVDPTRKLPAIRYRDLADGNVLLLYSSRSELDALR